MAALLRGFSYVLYSPLLHISAFLPIFYVATLSSHSSRLNPTTH